MKKFLLKIFFVFVIVFAPVQKVFSYDFNVLVLPTELLESCNNYFCFPDVSNIVAQDVIKTLNQTNTIKANTLYDIRKRLYSDNNLKDLVIKALSQYKTSDKVDFDTLQEIADKFSVKSILLITSWTNNDKTPTSKRDLWEILEVNSAFDISYPYNLVVNTVLTDNVNNVIMWSAKFNKGVSNSDGYFIAKNHTQAISQLEKIKQYSKNVVSANISQNIYLRFFPKDSKSADIKMDAPDLTNKPQFIPDALKHLSPSRIMKELEKEKERDYSNPNEFIYQF